MLRLTLLTAAALALTGCFDPASGTDDSSDGSSTTQAPGSTGPTSPPACVPGDLEPCACPNGTGNQRCNDEGTAYGPCECPPGGTDTGPSDDTTSGSDSGPGESSGGDSTGDTTGGSSSGGEESGTTEGESSSESTGMPGGPLQVGEECDADADCMTLVCWDFNDYDPFCFGAACSVNCENNDECVAAMAAAGAPDPSASDCGPDGRCTTLGTGFGAYACAGG